MRACTRAPANRRTGAGRSSSSESVRSSGKCSGVGRPRPALSVLGKHRKAVSGRQELRAGWQASLQGRAEEGEGWSKEGLSRETEACGAAGPAGEMRSSPKPPT